MGQCFRRDLAAAQLQHPEIIVLLVLRSLDLARRLLQHLIHGLLLLLATEMIRMLVAKGHLNRGILIVWKRDSYSEAETRGAIPESLLQHQVLANSHVQAVGTI